MTAGSSASPPLAGETSLQAGKPVRKQFARRDQPRLSPVEAARQGRAVALALQTFSPAAAVAFLNTDQPGFGRPLDRAVESADGLAAVENLLTLRLPPME